MPSPDALAEIESLGVADVPELAGDLWNRNSRSVWPVCDHSAQKGLDRSLVWGRKGVPNLKASPHGAIQEFGVIGRGNYDDVAR